MITQHHTAGCTWRRRGCYNMITCCCSLTAGSGRTRRAQTVTINLQGMYEYVRYSAGCWSAQCLIRVRPAPMKFRRVQVLKVQTGTAYKLSTDRYRIQILGVHSHRQIAIVILIGRFLAINRYRRYHLVYRVHDTAHMRTTGGQHTQFLTGVSSVLS